MILDAKKKKKKDGWGSQNLRKCRLSWAVILALNQATTDRHNWGVTFNFMAQSLSAGCLEWQEGILLGEGVHLVSKVISNKREAKGHYIYTLFSQ